MDTFRQPIVNFSLRKEVFFVAVGSIAGAFAMHTPRILFDLFGSTPYLITLLVAARAVNSNLPEVGFLLHLSVATIIGIVTGIFLHRVFKYNISKLTNGIIYGIISGIVVFVVFAIPVSQLVLGPNQAEVLSELDPQMTLIDATHLVEENLVRGLLDSLSIHIIWGATLGIISSILTRKFGANYQCYRCDVEFSKIQTYNRHTKHIHENPSPSMKKILILGGGYGGVNVLTTIQKYFEDDINVGIELVSESNFFLHTPMLPEMATGTIEPRHIATPIRKFCRRARFYQAKVARIDLSSKTVTIQRVFDKKERPLSYDYLVLALGGKTNFFGNKNIEQNSFTIKSLDDAIKIRNHIISVLEDADQESEPAQQSRLVTFVVVGGGFSGVETVGELNDFVRESAQKFYRNIDPNLIKVILVAAGEKILPEIGDLGGYAKESLQKAGVTIITNTRLDDATKDFAILDNGEKIPYGTLIWAGGNVVDDAIAALDEHHKSGRVLVNEFLRLKSHHEVFALGDCAHILDPRTNTTYPPTAQHAIREAKTVSANLIAEIEGFQNQISFEYDTKGSMAKIGKKNGVALLLGHEFRGFAAWLIWKQYYLSTLPTAEKRIRVGLDWFVDLFFPRDITRLSNIYD